MAFEIFKLVGSIMVDGTAAEKSLSKVDEKAGGVGQTLLKGIGTAAKWSAAVVAAGVAAVGAFVKSSVDVGMAFDASMSQVAATMGVAVDEISNLRDFALEMGSTTAFSATEAADALNYMALAGYDAETSMEMLPNVLNLAAAGGIALASASDMVTDASSALGLSLEETSDLVDKMAQASSKSNTSVAQLGDAILSIGGTAKMISGGTTELSTALGILADNGIKGSEAGTHLRNIILSLTAPTDKAKDELVALGVSAVDASGEMRPMEDILSDLNEAMADMTSAKRVQTLNAIFNKADLSSVNALLDTGVDRWEELSAAIDDSAGAAGKMADTQLDNLAGDITMFKSALEGAKIEVSDALTPTLREFVQFGTNAVSQLATEFSEGGLGGAVGSLVSTLKGAIAQLGPKIVAIFVGLMPPLLKIVEAALPLLVQLLDLLTPVLEFLLSDLLAPLITLLADGLSAALDWVANTAIPWVINAVNNIVDAFESFRAKVQTVKDNVNAHIDAIKNRFSSLKAGIDEKIAAIKNKVQEFQDKVQNAKDRISSFIDNIKSKFQFNITWPHIPMPHFGINPSGWKIGDLLQGSIPSLSVDWYAKAMDAGRILTEPTIFGYDANAGKVLAGGEAGSETVVGTASLMTMIRSAAASASGTRDSEIIAILLDIQEALERLSELQMVLYPDRLVGGLVRPMDAALGRLEAQKARGSA